MTKPKYTPEQRKAMKERKRIREAMRKQRKKRAKDGTIKLLIAKGRAECVKRENIMRFVLLDPERPDCWPWNGQWRHSSFNKSAKPLMQVTEYGEMFADKAVWLMLGNKPLKPGQFFKTKCGHKDCVSPEHLYVTNNVLERARKSMALTRSEETAAADRHSPALEQSSGERSASSARRSSPRSPAGLSSCSRRP